MVILSHEFGLVLICKDEKIKGRGLVKFFSKNFAITVTFIRNIPNRIYNGNKKRLCFEGEPTKTINDLR